LCNGVAGSSSPRAAGGTCASHRARPRADGLRGACLFPNPGPNFDESVAADAWITWSLQPNSYPDIATNHYLWFVRRGHRGGGIAYSIVRGKPTPEYRSSVAGKVNWQQSRSSASHWWWLACVPLLVAK